ncbi:type VI secretion system-associated FHA domain protein TagH [Sphingosinicella rhizophila]|uniref:Type VI secretion system-associated FHA domain protein TagH n=1 Tax=Sphingosinicella rhizophila TaxID=3050082 RepID=A0ABU3Q624_9SPHN|nr:type VI secretion system-associated FHA domain protein TagH [Sphingosinicella sp. GR2756]MDT9598861.1 type VI secretion system-associated FHA domain protein TagH [Sphingosinicella sp. GR2756]
MFLLKLFHESDQLHPVDARMLNEGTTRVGRDPAADWVIADPECEVSRTHLELSYRDGALRLRPLGANGVFRADGERMETGSEQTLGLGAAFRFGKYRVVVDPSPFASQATNPLNQTMVLAAPFGDRAEIPSDWADSPEPPPLTGDGSLLEAFCEGAKLDASAFSEEDPADVMRRAGAIYRQMILGVGDLMSERSSAKTQYRMDRTTIGQQDNNPFKWAPTQRLAIDLLLSRDSGFLSGPAALKASFEDLKRHLLSTFCGFRASLLALVDIASPKRIEERIEGQKLFLKGRSSALWTEYEQVHRDLDAQMRDDLDGSINRAFISAYEQKMRDLNNGGGL